MAKQRYIVMPEIEWVNGAPVPFDRLVLLTPEEARYDLAQGRIYLDGTQPPVTPTAPVLVGSDVITLSRGGLSYRVTMDDLIAFLDDQPGGPTLALSTLVFKAGVSAGAILAAITMPAGWSAAAETTFGGRAGVSGANLVAAIDIAPATAVAGSIRLKATSPDTLTSITQTFAVAFEAVTAPPVPDVTAPVITSAIAFSQAENAALVINLTASEAVTWAKIGGTDAAAFTLDAAAATLTLAAKDFDVPSDSDGNNTFGVQVRATDAAGNASTQTITVTITNLFDIPRTALTAANVPMAYNVATGAKVLVLPPLVEGEARAVSVSWLTPDSATGDVFRNALAGPSSSTVEQRIPVDVTTTQGGLNPVTTRFTIVVPAVAVPDTTAPTITSAIAFSQAENAALVITLTANEAVTWAKIGGSDAAAFTLDAAAGTLTLAGKDFDVPSDSDGNNTFGVQVRATDAAGNASTQTITVTITNLFDTARTPLTAGSVSMAYDAANGTKVLDLPPLVEGEARSVSVSWLTPDSATGDVFRNAMTGPGRSTSEQQIPVDVTTTVGGANPVVTRFTIVVPAVASTLARMALNTPIIVNGNSKNAQRHANDFVDHTLALAGGRFYRSPHFRQAKGGDSVLDFQQRMDACLAIGSYDGVDGAIWLGDATNDIGTRTTTALLAAYRDCATQWFTAYPNGRVFIELTALNTSITGANIPALDALNDGLLAMAAEAGWGEKLDVFDLRPLGKVSSGTAPLFDTSLSSDGKHYTTAKLASMAAQIVAAKLTAKISTDAILPASGDLVATAAFGANVLTNYALADADANGTPDGFTAAAGSGAAVATTMVTRNGRRAVKSAQTGSSTSASASDRLFRTQTGLSIPAGDVYEAIFAYDVSKSDGAGDTTDSATLFATVGTGVTFGSAAFASTGPLPAHAGVMRSTSNPIVPGSGASTLVSLSTEMAMRHPVGNVDAAFHVFEGWYLRQIEKKAYRAPFNQAYSRARTSDGQVSNLFAGPVVSKSGNIANATPGNVSGGAITIAYQWRKDGVAISGATSRFYDTAAATGVFDCVLTYTNALGTLTLTSSSITNP